jgi:hypothetical protein
MKCFKFCIQFCIQIQVAPLHEGVLQMGLLHKGIVQILDVFFEPGVEGCFILELMRGRESHSSTSQFHLSHFRRH